MKKNSKKNQKGSVLFTVICFATVLLMLSTTALSLASYSAKVSNTNVRESQAAVLAEDYLDEYLRTFGTNYKDLKDMVGSATEAAPVKFTVSLKDSSNNDVKVLPSSSDTAVIYAYKSGTSIIVKSEVTYAGETESCKAVFNSTSVSQYKSVAALETTDEYDIGELNTPISGDMIIESYDPASVVKFHNGNYNSPFKSNIFAQCNLMIGSGSTPENFEDTTTGYAPTISALGNIGWVNGKMKTQVGKNDITGKDSKDYGYDTSNLDNKNGYINTDKKFIVLTSAAAPNIGEASKPIDIYCKGFIAGELPSSLNNEDVASGKVDMSASKTDIENTFGSTGGNKSITTTGNIYCYKGTSQDGKSQDGTFVLNIDQTYTINGDLVVDGDIYLVGISKIKANNIYCTGNIYDASGNSYWKNGTTNAAYSSNNSIEVATSGVIARGSAPASNRATAPTMDYAPGLYDKNNPTADCKLVLPSKSIKIATTNNMFVDGLSTASDKDKAEKAKFIQDKYNEALNHLITDEYDVTNMTTKTKAGPVAYFADKPTTQVKFDDGKTDLTSDQRKKGIIIQRSCRLTEDEVGDYTDGSSIKITVDLDKAESDVVLLLPLVEKRNEEWWPDHKVYYTLGCTFNGQIRVSRSDNCKYFCYIMFYDPSDLDNNFYNKATSDPDYATLLASNQNITINFSQRDSHIPLCDTNFASMDATKINTSFDPNSTNVNNMILLPDGAKLETGDGGTTLETVIYGPVSNIKMLGNNNKFYGQVKVKSFTKASNGDYYNIVRTLPDDESVLDYINSALPSNGETKLAYYTN